MEAGDLPFKLSTTYKQRCIANRVISTPVPTIFTPDPPVLAVAEGVEGPVDVGVGVVSAVTEVPVVGAVSVVVGVAVTLVEMPGAVVPGTPGMTALVAGMVVVPTTGKVVVEPAAEGTIAVEPMVDATGTVATEPDEATTTVELVSLCVGSERRI